MIILIKLKIIYKDLFYLIVYVRSITKIINYIVEQKLFIKNNNLNLLYDYNYLIDRII